MVLRFAQDYEIFGVGETDVKTGLGSLILAAFIMFLLSPAGAQQPPPKSVSPPQTSPVQAQPAQLVSPATPHPPELQFVIVLDPAHGGTDNGALLAPNSPEKNYTLALAGRLRDLLNASGISSISTRDADTTVDDTARAVAANGAHPAACILLHATSTGNGVHLFTSSLAVAGKKIPPESPPHISALASGTGQLRNRKPEAGIRYQRGPDRPARSRSAGSHFSDAARQPDLPCGRR